MGETPLAQNDPAVLDAADDTTLQDNAFLLTPPPTATAMSVTKRNGSQEPVDLNKIVRAVQRNCEGLHAVDPMRVATRTISGLYNGATTRELDELSIRTAALLTAEEPEYSRLAARLLADTITKEVTGQEIHAFSQSILRGHEVGLINDRLLGFVQTNARKLNDALDASLDRRFDYFGLRTLYDRYLLRHPHTRKVIETPQQFFLRIACALSEDVPEALALYRRMGNLDYLPSSPTLFNAGTTHEQLSSCFLLDSPIDSLESIYQKYGDIAQLSKFSGGIGVSFTRVRSRGSLIKSTNGHSNGIVPWLKTLDSSVAAVNQGGKRKGAACVYLEPWHADVEEFLELRDNTGDEARRTHNLNLANWIPDLFMQRVEADADWSLFDPRVVPEFTDLFGDDFEHAYEQAELQGKATKSIKARELYSRMMRTLAQTGNGWMTFKDKCNRASNQTAKAGNVIHLSNLCTEILEVTIQIPDDLKKNLTIVKALLKPIRSDIYINVIMQKINSMYKRVDNSVEILPITVTTSLDETERNLIQELSINLKNFNDAQDRELIFAPYVSNRYEQRMNQIEELSNKAQALRRKYIPEKFDLDSKSKLNTKSKMLKSNYLYRKYLETNDNKYLKEIDLNLIDAELLIAENVESGSKGHYNKYKIIEDFDIDEYLTQDEIAVMDTVDLIFYLETIEKENPLITTFLNDLPASMINYIYGFEVKLEKRQAEAMNTTSRFKVYKPSK